MTLEETSNTSETSLGFGGRVLRAVCTAVMFLTRIPVAPWLTPTSEDVIRGIAFFPLVGTLIGAIHVGALITALQLWPVWLAVVLAIVVEVLTTGAFHEDALADCCDALGGGWTQEDVIRILKDSRLGTFGVIGLGLALAVRMLAVVAVLERCGVEQILHWGSLLWAGTTGSRWVLVVTIALCRPVPARPGLSGSVAGKIGWGSVLVATACAFPVMGACALWEPVRSGFALCGVVLIIPVFVRYFVRRVGGMTGDGLGSVSLISHLLILLAMAARWP